MLPERRLGVWAGRNTFVRVTKVYHFGDVHLHASSAFAPITPPPTLPMCRAQNALKKQPSLNFNVLKYFGLTKINSDIL